jgi:hypothetical protein
MTVTGRALPNTFYVKHATQGAFDAFSDFGAVFGTELFDLPYFFAGSGLALFALGAWRVLEDREDRALRALVIATPWVWMLAAVWGPSVTEPLAFYWHRYFEPAIPFLLVPIAVSVAWLGTTAVGVARGLPRTRKTVALSLAALPLIAAALVRLPDKLVSRAHLFAGNCENIQEMQVELGAWVARNAGATDWIATHDAGAIRFVSDRPVLDMAGLNDHRVLDRGLAEVIREVNPRYAIVMPSWYPRLADSSRYEVVERVSARHYTICERCNQGEMIVIVPIRGWRTGR